MNDHQTAVHLTDGQLGAAKAGAAWSATGIAWWLESIGVNSWGDVAAMLAALYSFLLICEWIWKRIKRKKERVNGRG